MEDKAGNKIITGSSLKGALRARMEKIINTIINDDQKAKQLKEFIFGTEELKKSKDRKKRNLGNPQDLKLMNQLSIIVLRI
ncbi:MAG TPA: RAMP superfamily CRISPR-associated protein [Ignavibacteriales bacterium]|nr:RAMP superfamily CRISPR-associated protein [Ignavibacteriales bacterium]HOL82266.1 RAMP superfamily CRISPR-associated protein [Ignavibacteriales bacterium]HPP34486.1 RAMP superfamily CRISPR-associated protein [Ignavibacteriales bacterium]HRR19636.1 RAMP superfamily CRISPR-associated protein [Ignavibacteriales bacterium]HRT98710.1 RAMP superfamily CRISPR-associated protein [Ignavibacteriales bacterium]